MMEIQFQVIQDFFNFFNKKKNGWTFQTIKQFKGDDSLLEKIFYGKPEHFFSSRKARKSRLKKKTSRL